MWSFLGNKKMINRCGSCSKKIENHVGLIKIFICDYNDNLKLLPIFQPLQKISVSLNFSPIHENKTVNLSR
ncbi:hypothetical protein PNK_1272 [Candidatus Protochlamydia naegleriophila]|uniref:Uncharacterized protein n=1 Tax=Candidatus Protochlamydia naegleriophila TaxID=389348 RepID=A0A0U5JA40_9BACT|nr:hypothetical protein PNK_1272 [Candidatus Protochlamydia naegleriophila]